MRILFVVSDFDMGGITSSLRNLSNELIKRGHNIDILNLPMYKQLPQGFNNKINLIDIEGIAKYWNTSMSAVKLANGWRKVFLLAIGVLKKLCNRIEIWNDIAFLSLPVLKEYDLAIGFRQSPIDYYVASKKVCAKKSIGFWHVDPDYSGDTSSWDKCLYDMDLIVGVSDATSEKMMCHYPKLKGKLRTVYNIFDVEKIRSDAKQYENVYRDYGFNIVTVSRIDFETQKNHQRIPEICRRLKDEGESFHWTIVGDGPERENLIQLIKESNLEKEITLVGAKDNPYPYIREADLFVLTSSWESYGMVVMESLILGTPVVAGDYPALKEILSDNYGIRTENSVDGIYRGIKKILNDQEKYRQIKESCLQFKYSTDETYKQFLKLCGD